jgi:hypothetical protein
MNCHRHCGFAATIWLVALCSSELWGDLFREDFENQPLNTLPSGWTATYNDYSPIRVGVTDAAAGQGSRSLFCGDYVPTPQIGLSASFPQQSQGTFLLKGMIRAEQTDERITPMRLRGPNFDIYNYLELGSNGVFRYADGFPNVIDSAVPYQAGQWYTLKFLIDMDQNRWNIAISNQQGDQVLSVENLRFVTSQPSYFDQVNYVGALASSHHNEAQWYIDDISLVRVPEPSTIALLLTGAVGLIACAWRRRRAA